MEILMYITLVVTVFNFLMFLGMNSRLGNMELIQAQMHLQWGTQINFNEEVQKYHVDLDTWLAKVDTELDAVTERVNKMEVRYVESTSKR